MAATQPPSAIRTRASHADLPLGPPAVAPCKLQQHTARRQLLLMGTAAMLSLPCITAQPVRAAGPLDALLLSRQPERGDCPTCIGAVDGTLGSCSDTPSCVSSYDDRPDHFLAPWDFDAGSKEQAMQQLVQAVKQAGASRVEQQGSTYLYAVFDPEPGPLSGLGFPGATDDVEFLIPDDNDTRVEIRSASRLPNLPDGQRQRKRLEAIRMSLGWEQVPILRNRRRALVVIESPWDSYGPTPPASQQLGGMRFEDGLSD